MVQKFSDFDVVLGIGRRQAERYFGHADFQAGAFTAYRRKDKLLLLWIGRNKEKEEKVRGYLFATRDGKILASSQMNLLDRQKSDSIRVSAKLGDLKANSIYPHGDIGSTLFIPVFLTDRGTAVVAHVAKEEIISREEVTMWELFS